MKKIIHFIGIDVSKETLGIALIGNNDKSNIYSSKVTNNKTGFNKMKQWLKVENVSLQEAVFCIEHTGMYSKPVSQFVLSQKGNLWMEMFLKIIRSMGVQRDKNDKIGAMRIALYAQRCQDEMKLYEPLLTMMSLSVFINEKSKKENPKCLY
jgi:transposase